MPNFLATLIGQQDNHNLNKMPSKEEVRRAVLSIDKSKAQGQKDTMPTSFMNSIHLLRMIIMAFIRFLPV